MVILWLQEGQRTKPQKNKTKEFSIKYLFGVYTYIELFKHMNTRGRQSVTTQPTPTRGGLPKIKKAAIPSGKQKAKITTASQNNLNTPSLGTSCGYYSAQDFSKIDRYFMVKRGWTLWSLSINGINNIYFSPVGLFSGINKKWQLHGSSKMARGQAGHESLSPLQHVTSLVGCRCFTAWSKYAQACHPP